MDMFDFDGVFFDFDDPNTDTIGDGDYSDSDFDVEGFVLSQPELDVDGITFGASSDVDARNLAKSELLDELKEHHIYISGGVRTDSLGGLTSYSGEKVEDAINAARDRGVITHPEYKELQELLKKACRFQ